MITIPNSWMVEGVKFVKLEEESEKLRLYIIERQRMRDLKAKRERFKIFNKRSKR